MVRQKCSGIRRSYLVINLKWVEVSGDSWGQSNLHYDPKVTVYSQKKIKR